MTYTDSEAVQTRLDLLGVWVMDPALGGQSARQYPYGASQREASLDAMGQTTYYVGRVDPVTDYGEHEDYAVGVTVDIPHGATWRRGLDDLHAFVASKRILHFRDNRGRSLYGVMERLREKDVDWGTQVSFAMGRRSHPVEMVVAG